MISQYSTPEEIVHEFWEDQPRAKFWLHKNISARSSLAKIMNDGGWDVMDMKTKVNLSEPIFYESPKTGNKWMVYLSNRNDEGFHMYVRTILYSMTAQYMTIMIPVTTFRHDSDGNVVGEMNGINVYTSHVFQRMHQRAGVNMSDRINIIRNFTEYVATGWSDVRPPREGEEYNQILLRTPASWIRGHTIDVGDSFVNIYRTFWTDMSMTPSQLKDVRTFKKFADKQASNSKLRY